MVQIYYKVIVDVINLGLKVIICYWLRTAVILGNRSEWKELQSESIWWNRIVKKTTMGCLSH